MSKTQAVRFSQYFAWVFLYFHAFVFLGVNALLIISNLLTTPETPWYIIPLSFWGMVLLTHTLFHFVVLSQQSARARSAHTEADRSAVASFFFWMAFYCHLSVYVVSSILMGIINAILSPQEHWALIVIGSWGLWVAAHFVVMFLTLSQRLRVWREQKIQLFTRYTLVTQSAERAVRAGKIRFGFWLAWQLHLSLYLVAMIFLAMIDVLSTQGTHWVIYPLLGWGIIIVAHWLMTKLILSRRIDLL